MTTVLACLVRAYPQRSGVLRQLALLA